MKNLISQYLRIVVLPMLLLLLNSTSVAQSIWVDAEESKSLIGAELMIPAIDDMVTTEFPTSVVLLYSRIRLNDAVSIKVDLPISHFSVDGDLSETDIGNPYLGIGLHNMTPGLSLDMGVRLPFAPKNKLTEPESNLGLITGALIENHNLGIYMPDTYSLTANFNYRWESDTGLILKVGGAPDLIVPNGDFDNEFLFNYYGQILYGGSDFNIGAGLTGLYLTTEEGISNGDRTIYNLGLLGSYNFDAVKLGTYLRVPLDDDINDILNFVLGLNIALRL